MGRTRGVRHARSRLGHRSRRAGGAPATPTALFVLGLLLSMTGVAYALRTVPVGTGYAVWVGIVGCVAGLKLVG
ncbi:SMR family transporter [Streptomyces sp. NPDC003697]